jgi:hypothetical protein
MTHEKNVYELESSKKIVIQSLAGFAFIFCKLVGGARDPKTQPRLQAGSVSFKLVKEILAAA